MTLKMWEMGWVDIAAYLQRETKVILPVGSTEQHGRHLPLGTDAYLPLELADRIAEKTNIAIAPALVYGMSQHHLCFPGTISLKPQTLIHVMEDILQSLYRHGFRKVFIVNGHGGNVTSIRIAMANIMTEHADFEIVTRQWWQEECVADLVKTQYENYEGGHADAVETSPMLALYSHLVHLDRSSYNQDRVPVEVLTEHVFKKFYPHGVIGIDPKRADNKLGEKLIAEIVKLYSEQITQW